MLWQLKITLIKYLCQSQINRIQGKYMLGKIAAARAYQILKSPGILRMNLRSVGYQRTKIDIIHKLP